MPLPSRRLRSLPGVNENHAKLCASPEWADRIQTEILPWVTAGMDLGQELLEVGPGPGAATGWLHRRVGLWSALWVSKSA